MNTFVFAFVVSLLISTQLVVLILYFKWDRLVSRRKRSLRDSHSKAISRLGGIGIALGFLLTVAAAYKLIGQLPKFTGNPLSIGFQGHLSTFLAGALVIFLLGLADDIWDIRVRYKLLGQLLVAIGFTYYGIAIEHVEFPVYGILSLGWFSYPLTVLWIVGVINALNLIDGLDGLASEIAMIALLYLCGVVWMVGNLPVMLLGLGLIGAILGFWLFNRPPASIFMGDSGSLFLGYCLATLSLWGFKNAETQGISLLPVLLLGVPVLDTLLSFLRRYLHGVPFYSADKDHLHHRLLAQGYTPRQAALILDGLAVAFGALALLGFWHQGLYLITCLLALMLGYFALFFMEYDEIRKPMVLMKTKGFLKKQRSFVIALSENIEVFFQKDASQEELLKSFAFWAVQMKIPRYTIEMQQQLLAQYRETPYSAEQNYRKLLYEQGVVRVQLFFATAELDIDSDLKGTLTDRVVLALIDNLYHLNAQDLKGALLHRVEITGETP